ncbi:hypothetical protein U1Q18_037902 [Sarracenia purpurea var. burkii]
MMKLKEEVDSQSRKNVDACLTINSLKDALLKAENNISELLSEKKNAEEEISALISKLNACIEELVGTTSSLESRSLELSSHLNNLHLLLKDDTLGWVGLGWGTGEGEKMMNDSAKKQKISDISNLN